MEWDQAVVGCRPEGVREWYVERTGFCDKLALRGYHCFANRCSLSSKKTFSYLHFITAYTFLTSSCLRNKRDETFSIWLQSTRHQQTSKNMYFLLVKLVVIFSILGNIASLHSKKNVVNFLFWKFHTAANAKRITMKYCVGGDGGCFLWLVEDDWFNPLTSLLFSL